MSKLFVWKGIPLSTTSQIYAAMEDIFYSNNEELGQEFIAEYEKTNKHARKNIGYLTGYSENMLDFQKFFRVAHPLFGYQKPVTAENAFEIGKQLGEKWAKEIPQ